MDIIAELRTLQDIKYGDFHSKLMPNVDRDRVIGVRTPQLRALAKRLSQEKDIDGFLTALPHYYYEENNLHAFIIEGIKDFSTCLNKVEEFLPYIDNWATCDTLRPKCFNQRKDILYAKILDWIKSDKPYVIRFAIGALNSYFTDQDFSEEHLRIVSTVQNSDYYVKMMQAWYYATVLSKRFDIGIEFIKNSNLPKWVRNKSLQKGIESLRINPQRKELLRKLKI